MKLLTEKQLREHDAAIWRGAVEGTVASGIAAVGGSYMLHRRWPYYRSLPFSLKLMGVTIIVAPCLAIQAERRGLQYDRSQWAKAGEATTEREEEEETEERLERTSVVSRIGDWAYQHKWSIIFGTWATGMGISGAIVSRNKYQTFAQKIVQARVWAQGLTVGVLIAAAILAQSRRDADSQKPSDHSWQKLVEGRSGGDGQKKVSTVERGVSS